MVGLGVGQIGFEFLLGDDPFAVFVVVFAAAIFQAAGGNDDHAMLDVNALTIRL